VEAFGEATRPASGRHRFIRNKAKVRSAIGNARLPGRAGSHGWFSRYLWGFVAGRPIRNAGAPGRIPAVTPLAEKLSKDMKARA
jgi:3-methyladenine DNA glycosylase Tag